MSLRNWFLESVKFDEFSVEINHRRTRSKEEEKSLSNVLKKIRQNRIFKIPEFNQMIVIFGKLEKDWIQISFKFRQIYSKFWPMKISHLKTVTRMARIVWKLISPIIVSFSTGFCYFKYAATKMKNYLEI